MERILIQNSELDHDNEGSSNSRILLETYDFERRIRQAIADSNTPCVRGHDGECLVISPLAFWDYDPSALQSETAIIDTLSASGNVTVAGILVTPQMVLAGRGLHEDETSSDYDRYDFDYAEHIVLTYFFREADCLGNSESSVWREVVELAAGKPPEDFQAMDPELLALQYAPSQGPFKYEHTTLSTFIYLAYTSFFAYVTWSMRKMRRVHSRIGLTFTALVEIAVSTITSLSVCALVGFKVTMVPWELLPIVIVFVGAENMFNLLLATTAALYFATYPSTTSRAPVTQTPRQAKALVRNRENFSQAQPPHVSPVNALWQTLNPSGDPILHLRIESPVVLSLNSNPPDHGPEPGSASRRIPTDNLRRGKSRFSWKLLVWTFKIVVLPITTTTSALYLLLLYLLKDAELLEAQRHRAEATPSKIKAEPKSLEHQISFGTLPRSVEADIDIVAATKDGRLIVCVSVRSELAVWWRPSSLGIEETEHESGGADDWRYSHIDTTDLMLRSRATSNGRSRVSIICAAIDSQGKYFAVGTSTGVIGVWQINRPTSTSLIDIRALSHLSLPAGATSAVVSMTFVNAPSSTVLPTLLSILDDNRTMEWTIGSSPQATYIGPDREGTVTKSLFVHAYPDDRILVAFCMDDGCTELVEIGTSYPLIPEPVILRGDASDPITVIHASRLELGGSSRLVIGTASMTGGISIWDGASGRCITSFDSLNGCVNNLRLCPITPGRCDICSEVAPEGFSVTFSVGQIVQFYKVHLPPDANHRCSCSRGQLNRMSSWDNLGRRSRSSSVSSSSGNLVALTNGIRSNGGSPLQSRARLATSSFDASPFPVSAHGVHSRKASEKEKDSARRMSDVLSVPIPFEDFDAKPTAESSLVTTPPAFSWEGATLVRAFADIMCERGGWDVLDGRIAGVRRRARQQNIRSPVASNATSSTGVGLSSTTLERWEVWVLDPSQSNLRSSPLVALTASTSSETDPSDQTPRLPFTRVSPYMSIRSYSLAGFGNTLGILDFSSICC
ncbi:hypothetical protein ONZ45_g775 [Pleurotus djamor]|nr:hypothetical protein ONZ45_g775 [Pleurotus djamor]